MLLRNGSSWFRFASGDNVPGDIPSDAIAQQFATHRRKLVDLFFIALKIAGELIRIFLHKLNRNVLDVCLSDIAQVYHPSDIGFPNIVILFKCNAVLNQGKRETIYASRFQYKMENAEGLHSFSEVLLVVRKTHFFLDDLC